MEELKDLWLFLQPFAFGALGGWAAILMSLANRKAALAETKSKLVLKYKTAGEPVYKIISDAFDESTNISDEHKSYTTAVSCLVGGISGMIAVNAFNSDGTASQTFSIAIIAGVSGFAFLKRSALIDDGNSDQLVGAESKFLEEYIETYIMPLKKVEALTSRFTSNDEQESTSLTNELIDELFDEEGSSEVPLQAETPPAEDTEMFEEFIRDLSALPNITESDVNYIKYLRLKGMSLHEILEIIGSPEE